MTTDSARFKAQRMVATLLFIGMTALMGCAPKQKAVLPTPSSDDSTPIRTEVKDFILGPGDELEISVWRFNDLNRVARISRGGNIQMPLVGDVHVAGLNAFDLRDVLAERLREYIVDPQVSVSVKSLKSQKVFVLGEVSRPGVFPIEPNFMALDGVAHAGGFTQDANQAQVLLVRKGPGSQTLVYPLNLDRTLNKGDVTYNPPLEAGDVLYVPPTTMVDMARFANRLTQILSPLIAAEAAFLGFEDMVIKWPQAQAVFEGKTGIGTTSTTTIVFPQIPAR